MDENVSYDYLWQAYQKEKQTNQLLLLSKTFYEDVTEFINNKNLGKNTEQSTVDNASRLLNEFFEKRKQKILLYVAYNKQLPQPISNIELEFYNKILQTVKHEKLDKVKAETNKQQLRSLKDIPEIILPSGNKFGPLVKDQTFEANNEQDKLYLIENAICEQIY